VQPIDTKQRFQTLRTSIDGGSPRKEYSELTTPTMMMNKKGLSPLKLKTVNESRTEAKTKREAVSKVGNGTYTKMSNSDPNEAISYQYRTQSQFFQPNSKFNKSPLPICPASPGPHIDHRKVSPIDDLYFSSVAVPQ